MSGPAAPITGRHGGARQRPTPGVAKEALVLISRRLACGKLATLRAEETMKRHGWWFGTCFSMYWE